MNKNLNPPGALGKMPMMWISQIAKGQEELVIFAFVMTSIALSLAVGQ
jgi:hypothetical protein